jgi:hypothetical protein
LRRRGPGGLKGQIKVFDDLVYDFVDCRSQGLLRGTQ